MDQLSNLRVAYRILEDRVNCALQAHVGDHQWLGVTRNDTLCFLSLIDEAGKRDLLTFDGR